MEPESKVADTSPPSAIPGIPMSYEEFLLRNPAIGFLKIQASRARQAIPLSDIRIYVMQDFQGVRVLFFNGLTDENGLIERIELPAPPRDASLDAENPAPGAVYQVYAASPGFESQRYEAEIFENITAILPVTLSLAKE